MDKEVKCSECGKLVSFHLMPVEIYTYKFYFNGKRYYQCSYTCWRKFEREHELDKGGSFYAKGNNY